MATVTNDADEIRRQMAAIRRVLHEDVREVVATANAVTDYRRYLTMYPWLTVGVAVTAGYLIVPRRHKTAEALANVATHADVKTIREAVESAGEKAAEASREKTEPERGAGRGKGLVGAALGIVTPLVLRAAQGYALNYVQQWIMEQQSATLHAGPAPTHPGQASGPGPQPGPGTHGGMGPGRPFPGPGTRRAGGPNAG